MKLLIIEKGMPIHYNTNEHTIETVFGIDDTNRIIQNFTFQCQIHYDSAVLQEALANVK